MKYKFNQWTFGLIAMICLMGSCAVRAQTTNSNPVNLVNQLTSLLNQGFLQVGVPQTINGVTFIATTNQSGGYTFIFNSLFGSVTNTPPTNPADALREAQALIAANNPANIGYYNTNDLTARLGAWYVQDNGAALISASVAKYGLIKALPNLAPEGEIFQGTKEGKQSTAAADLMALYRKPIGDVAAIAGAGGGWDNWAQKPFAGVKGEVEYRQNAHLGEFVGARFNFEGVKNDSADSIAGFLVGGGVTGSF